MYNMSRYTASDARQRFAELLTEAEQGKKVVIERRGVTFRLVAETPGKATGRQRRASPVFCECDPAVLAGQWSWEPAADGWQFISKRSTQTPRTGQQGG